MVNCTINGAAVSVAQGTTILEAARQAGVKIPTLCYLKDLNEIGACRVCVVEVKGAQRLFSSCNQVVEEGMEILTNSPRVRQARRTNVELILAEHNDHCPTCVRSGNCSLQQLARELNVTGNPYEKSVREKAWEGDFPVIRDNSKCIKCMRCVQICDKVQGIGVWQVEGSGNGTTVGVAEGKVIDESRCVACGQCITHCPVGALRARDDTDRLLEALADPEKVVVVQVAPAVRAAWGEDLGLPEELATEKRMAAALRRCGADYVFDTNFSADLTIMEEGSEFLEKLTHRAEHTFPMFTSCCPGWVRYAKALHPEIVDQLSTAKSPQQMFGAVAKSYFAEKAGIAPEKIFCVSVMPCVSKKTECAHETFSDAGAGQDVDLSVTTRELDRLVKIMGIDPAALPEEEFDSPLGAYTGAAVIFGATGGVMEAALRSAYFLATGKNPDPDAFRAVRGQKGTGAYPWKEAAFDVAGIPVRTATVHGLGNTGLLLDALRRGEVEYDFVEVMACPGGCVGGGGQPFRDGLELAEGRAETLYELDRTNALRFSHENPEVQELYRSYLEKPLSERAHKLLHTDHHAWKMPGED